MATDVIIVGAGLSGLIAARQLKATGKSVIVLDKGRSVGGRLATRRIGEGLADHGAQFFTVRTEAFEQQVEKWMDSGLVYIWGYQWSDGSVKRTTGEGHPRYVTRGGMNALAKNLAAGMGNIHLNTRISSVSWQGSEWWVTDTQNHRYEGRTLIMTPPVPQTLMLMKGVELAPESYTELERIKYGPCLCGLFVIDGDIDLPEPGAIQNFDSQVYWIADNQQKGISPNEKIITMHLEVRYSRAHYDDPDEETLEFLRTELEPLLTAGSQIKEGQLKRWRYSVPLTTYPHDVLCDSQLPVIFAGDAFGGRGRVEGAYLSGLKAGQTALELV